MLATALLSFFLTDPLAAQSQVNGQGEAETVDLIALRLESGAAIDVDGRLDEEAWERAIPITDFTQQEPVEGGTPSERTEIRVVYDEDALYIGAILYDDPEGIVVFQKRRDGFLSADDRFMWILDTFQDGRTGYFFETNAAGVMGDALISGRGGRGGGGGGGRGGGGGGGFGGGGGGRAWDGIWQVQTHIRPDGWSLEIQIPFRTLNFDPTSDSWGINFQRTVRRKNEEILWRGYRRNQSLRQPVHAGRLTGLEGMSQGIGLEAVPYAVTNWKNVPEEADQTTYPSDVGLDINYNITPSLRAGVSVNTDFAEAEVDQRRLNLTRFPLRFPERRDFFLEGSGVFSFAPSNGADPYFSRRIGLLEGEQIPLNYASRLGGQAGRYELGFFHVSTAELESADVDGGIFAGEQFTVARVKRGIFEQSTIGAIYTRRSTGVDPTDPTARAPKDQHTVGADLYYTTSRLFGDKNFVFQAFAAWNSNPDRGVERSISDLSSRGIRINYPNDIWSAHLSYREFGDDYDPAVGFVTRNGFRRIEPRIGWGPRPDIDWIRRFDFSAQFRHLESITTGIVEERSGSSRSSESTSRARTTSTSTSSASSSTSTTGSRSATTSSSRRGPTPTGSGGSRLEPPAAESSPGGSTSAEVASGAEIGPSCRSAWTSDRHRGSSSPSTSRTTTSIFPRDRSTPTSFGWPASGTSLRWRTSWATSSTTTSPRSWASSCGRGGS